MKKILIVTAIIATSGLICFYSADKLIAYGRSVIFKSGVVVKNNVSIRSGSIDQRNGSLATTTQDYSKEKGGVDDYNDGGSMPSDTFSENFTQCTSANNYCGTGDSTACAGGVCYQDNRTNLVWSDYLDGGANHTWFWVNNCWEPGSSGNPGSCTANGNVACQCFSYPNASSGCAVLGDGNWRVPHQKELMQVYINGSWGNLPHAGSNFWSATTNSHDTHYAWIVNLHYGNTTNNTKTTNRYSRCVR